VPHKLIFKKFHRIYWSKKVENFKSFDYGYYALRVLHDCILNFKHFETLVKVIKMYGRRHKRKFRAKFNIFLRATFFSTKKAKGLRMGRGKGALSIKISYVNAGTVILNIKKLANIRIFKLLSVCSDKLPVKCMYGVFKEW